MINGQLIIIIISMTMLAVRSSSLLLTTQMASRQVVILITGRWRCDRWSSINTEHTAIELKSITGSSRPDLSFRK